MLIRLTGNRRMLAFVYAMGILIPAISWAKSDTDTEIYSETEAASRFANFDASNIQFDLGMFSYHTYNSGKGTNEVHDLVGISYLRWGVGTFINSHDYRSYYVSYEHPLYTFNPMGNFDADIGAFFSVASGYEKTSLKTVAGATLLPALTLNIAYKKRIGATLFGNPAVVGIKFFIRPFGKVK